MSTNVTHPVPDSILGCRSGYPASKNRRDIPVLVYLREQISNAFGYNAKNLGITSWKHENHTYVVCYHDGEGFANHDMISESLHTSTTIGNKGLHGSGGKFSPILLVQRNQNVEHYVMSKCLDNGEFAACKMTLPGRCPEVVDALEIINPTQEALEGSKFEYTVCYITRYEQIGNRIAFQDVDVLHQLMDYVDSAIGNGLNVYYGDGVLIDKNNKNKSKVKVYSNLKESYSNSSSSSKLGGHYANVKVSSKQTYEDLFCPDDCRFRLDYRNVQVKANNADVVLDGVLKVGVYPALFRNRNQHTGFTSNGLIPVNGPLDKASHIHQPLKFSTSLILNCFKEEQAAKRLYKDPVYLGNCNDSLGNCMNLPIVTRSKEWDDVEQFEEFQHLFSNGVNKAKRRPFVRFDFEVTKCEISDGGHELNESEIRCILGGLDPFFNIIQRQIPLKIIQSIASDIHSKHDLTKLRSCLKKYFPWDNSGLDSLKIGYSGKKSLTVDFLSSEKKPFRAGEIYNGKLQYSADGIPVDPERLVEPVSGSGGDGIKLKHVDGGTWAMSIKPLSVVKDGQIVGASEEEWIEASKSCLHLPQVKNGLNIDGVYHNFIVIRTLPKTKVGHNSPNNGKNKKDERDGRSKHMFKCLGPEPNRYISKAITNNLVFLNEEHIFIDIFFQAIPQFQKWRDELWDEIRKRVAKAEFNLSHIDIGNLSEIGKKCNLNGEWGNNEEAARNFMLNHMILDLFKSEKVQSRYKQILDYQNKMEG